MCVIVAPYTRFAHAIQPAQQSLPHPHIRCASVWTYSLAVQNSHIAWGVARAAVCRRVRIVAQEERVVFLIGEIRDPRARAREHAVRIMS